MSAEDFRNTVAQYQSRILFLFSYDQVDLRNDTQYIQTQFQTIEDVLEMDKFNNYIVELQKNEFDNNDDLIGLFS